MSITGNIIRIIDDKNVILNIGAKDGVRIDMQFVIYEEGDMIYDPKTGNPIERLDIIKGEIAIVRVQEKISVGRSPFKEISMKTFYIGSEMPSLKIDKKQVEPLKKPLENSTIVVGDKVRQSF